MSKLITVQDGDIVINPVTGSITAYYADNARLETLTNGSIAVRSDTSADATRKRIDFQHADGTQRAYIGLNTDNALYVANEIHGQSVLITAEDNGGVARTILSGDPDGVTALFYNGVQKLFTDQAGFGTNDGLYFAGSSNHGFVPGAGTGALWLDSDDDTLYFRDDSGTDFTVAGGITLALPTGTTTDSTLRWGGSAWVEETNLQVPATGGIVELRSDASTDAENRTLEFMHQDGTIRRTIYPKACARASLPGTARYPCRWNGESVLHDRYCSGPAGC